MDRLEFLVEERELGHGGREDCAEPMINGRGLIEILNEAEARDGGYAGLPPQLLLAWLRAWERYSDVKVLRCICGDDHCSYATVRVEMGSDEVVWHGIDTSGSGSPAGLGPFRFSREAYDRALAGLT